VDRLLGEHGIPQDTVAGRQVFARQMEKRRLEETDPQSLRRLRRGWKEFDLAGRHKSDPAKLATF